MDAAKQATPHSVLIEQLMDSRVPKTEREHAARREIEMLREALRLPAALNAPEWIGLPDMEVFDLADNHLYGGKNYGILSFYQAIEAKLKEKNT